MYMAPLLLALAVSLSPDPTATVDATVVDRHSQWQDGLIVTETRLRVARVRHGDAPSEVSVRQLGGVVDGIAQVALDEPTLELGDRVALELHGRTWRVTGEDPAPGTSAERHMTTTANPN
jgi:hypothetical protein